MIRYYDEEDEIIKVKEVKDNFQAYLVEGASFTKNEEYPIIKDWMVPKYLPQKVIPFNKINEVKDISEYTICFYCRDEDFLKIKRNPNKYVSLFKKCNGIIGFDYSIHSDFPIIKQKEQINTNLSLSFFYGIRNIGVYPNIRLGDDSLDEEFFSAIPKNSIISIGTYGFIKSRGEKKLWEIEIKKIIDRLNPKAVIIYGSVTQQIINILQKNNIDFHVYISWKEERFKELKMYGSK